ncbi:hypothetical protein [Candidatus Protochlamydia amoebophila]|uniref:hypothetical protein n=1 Tax=Candidatus Protochlamydia amoebophila TaxID=362787 RepID=UPI00057EC83C|nr:hypothetical protein [Candidatus Protochlamydia amoebophila]
MENTSIHKQVKQIVLLLIMVVLSAVFLSAFFLYLYLYNLIGQSDVNKMLIDSTVFKNSQFEKREQQVVDRLEFSYFVPKLTQFVMRPVTFKKYQEFYRFIASENILQSVDEKLDLIFHHHSTVLTMKLRSDPQSQLVFQIAQFLFLPDHYFRIQLIGVDKRGGWVYFSRSEFYKKLFSLLTINQNF